MGVVVENNLKYVKKLKRLTISYHDITEYLFCICSPQRCRKLGVIKYSQQF